MEKCSYCRFYVAPILLLGYAIVLNVDSQHQHSLCMKDMPLWPKTLATSLYQSSNIEPTVFLIWVVRPKYVVC